MKKLINIYLLVTAALLFCCCGCRFDEPSLSGYVLFRNNTDHSVYIFGYDYDNGEILSPYKVFFEFQEPMLTVLSPHDKGYKTYIPYSEEDAGTSKRYQILVFKESTLEKYTKEELAEGNIYDALLVMSYEELKTNNFTMTYTGE